jgi:hypothetical protein
MPTQIGSDTQWISEVLSYGLNRQGREGEKLPPTSVTAKKDAHLYINYPIHLHSVMFN